MANVKISDLPAATSLASTDILPLDQGGVTKQASFSLLPILANGSSAITEAQQSRGRWTVLATDYLSDADRALVRAGTTVALDTALANAATYLTTIGGGTIRIPAGNYSLDNYRPKTDIEIVGDGYEATIINQGSAANPAYYALSDATTGQLIGIAFKNLKVVGFSGATVAAVKVEATTPYVVHKSTFDYKASSTYAALQCTCTSSSEIYGNKFKVESATTTSRSVTTTGGGAYNDYDLFLTGCGTGLAISAVDSQSTFKVVSDGSQVYTGQNNTLITPTVETISAASSSAYAAIESRGFNNTLINPTLTNVAAAKLSSAAGFRLDNYCTVINPRIQGSTSAPTYPFELASTCVATFIGGQALNITFTMRAYVSETLLNAQTFVADCSSYLGGNFTKLPKLQYSTIPIGSVAYTSLGTDTTPVAGTIYLAELWIDCPKSLTGIGVLNGSVAGTNNYQVALFDSTGTKVAQSATTLSAGTNAFQEIAFTAAYTAVPGRWWIGVQLSGTTPRFKTISASTYLGVKTKSSAGVFGTFPTQTVPTTFTADVGPIAYVY